MHPQRWILIVALALATGYVWLIGGFIGLADVRSDAATRETESLDVIQQKGFQVATFAGGCFWSTEAAFDAVPGVVTTTTGYTGGHVANPTYRQVVSGGTGHAEAVQVVFDASAVSYDELLEHYWRSVDPFVRHRQFCDVGSQYRPEVFVHDEAQRQAAEASKERVRRRFGRPALVEISAAQPFYRAEAHHQDYHQKYAAQYTFYRVACGRDRRLSELWGDPD